MPCTILNTTRDLKLSMLLTIRGKDEFSVRVISNNEDYFIIERPPIDNKLLKPGKNLSFTLYDNILGLYKFTTKINVPIIKTIDRMTLRRPSLQICNNAYSFWESAFTKC